jgi:hypothetical protein
LKRTVSKKPTNVERDEALENGPLNIRENEERIRFFARSANQTISGSAIQRDFERVADKKWPFHQSGHPTLKDSTLLSKPSRAWQIAKLGNNDPTIAIAKVLSLNLAQSRFWEIASSLDEHRIFSALFIRYAPEDLHVSVR